MNRPPKEKNQLPNTAVIARRAQPDVAIRILSGAKHHPAPEGPERERIATALAGFAMTVVMAGWFP